MQIVYQRTKSCDQLPDHPVIQKGDRNVKNNTNSGHPDVQSHPMIVSYLSKLFPAVIEDENPDHGEWDTDVV